MLTRCLAIMLASAALASSAAGQLVVHVESNGAAVYGAEVTAWSDSGRLAVGRTDGAGTVRLPLAQGREGVAFVTARRLGFAPARMSAPAADSIVLQLTDHSTELAAVAVTSRSLRCPAASDEAAVALWRRAAERYTAGQDTMPWTYIASVAEGTVTDAERGFGEPTERWTGGRHGGPAAVSAMSYGHPGAFTYGTYHPPFGPAYGRWIYPVTYGSAAGLFATPYFGERHTFVLLGRAADVTTIGFCARTYADPELEGELEVAGDTAIVAARWRYHLPHHAEDAGGEATFADSRFDGARYLVAVSSATWHRVRPGLFDQERVALDAWKFGHTTGEAALDSWNARGDRSAKP